MKIEINKEVIKNLLLRRLPFYRKADICVDTDGRTPHEVVQEIIERLKL
jgi:shikimate kinase